MKTKIWVGIGAFVIAGGSALDAAPLPSTATALQAAAPAGVTAKSTLLSSTANIVLAAQGGEGEGGEGGGEGGEAGIDPAAADKDPVEYNIALQVIAAHYHAGLAAYEGKETEAGAQMFAHGLSEVYIAMEDIFKKRGVTNLGKELEATVDAASSNKPAAEVRKRVQAVLKELKAAVAKGPTSELKPMAVKTQVLVNMLSRAAAQYAASVNDKTLEPYLDGLGFSTVAREEAGDVLPALRKTDKKKAAAIKAALDMANAAYPGIKRPAAKKVAVDRFLAAASAAQLATSH